MHIQLDVPYYSQVDNCTHLHGSGTRQCNLTSHAMFAQYLLRVHNLRTLSDYATDLGLPEPESFYGRIVKRYGDTTSNLAHTQALGDKELKIQTVFITNATVDCVKTLLTYDIPVPCGVLYKASGHWITIVGFNEDGWIVHDPYGCRAGTRDYYGRTGGNSGEDDFYSYETMRTLWGGSDSSGWIRYPIAIGDKILKTGIEIS